jgi:hypothetical protein
MIARNSELQKQMRAYMKGSEFNKEFKRWTVMNSVSFYPQESRVRYFPFFHTTFPKQLSRELMWRL